MRVDSGARVDAWTDDGDSGEVDSSAPDAALTDSGPPPECADERDCDDGDPCNGVELCLDGRCIDGEPIVCDDNDICNGLEVCDAGECVVRAVAACPIDDDVCNGIERCDPILGCVTEPGPSCDDGIDCTEDFCVDNVGCEHEARSARCVSGMTVGMCDPNRGCVYPTCSDVNCRPGPCFDAFCSAGSCVRVPRCQSTEECCAGMCVSRGCDDGNPCTADSCGPQGCVHTVLSDQLCDDGDACTVGDTCTSEGRCMPGARRTCSDGDPCTTEVCDPTVGCVSTPNADVLCTDGDACTVGDTCSNGGCVPGPRLFCNDANPCTADSCDDLLGCVFAPVPRGTSCEPGGSQNLTCDGAGNCCGRSFDCNGDGTCECPTACANRACPVATVCRSRADCDSSGVFGLECCVDPRTGSGTCYPAACLGCCRVVIDPVP